MLDNTNNDLSLFKKTIRPSKESILKLEKFIEILDTYQNKMNLIGKSTRIRIWSRHILDSAQIADYLHKENKKNIIVDIGTGAGFPGIVLSTLGRNDILLCEKSKKKISFLKSVIKECKLKAEIFDGKIEEYTSNNVKTVVSRAFAPLTILLSKVKHIICEDTTLVLHKGKSYMKEIEDAKSFFSFNFKCYKSLTNSCGKILKIKNIEKLNDRY